ncbi:MAG TPA: hypothetical protein VH054_15220 [Polyangiaceae bacterium]|nr:hypothetical protein [Polyangiaceae bacterium]
MLKRSPEDQMRTFIATCFSLLACAVIGCAVDGTDTGSSDELVTVGAHVNGNAAGWAYLRYEPSGPAFDYVHKGTSIQISGKWDKGARFVCAKADGKPWGWMLAENGEIGGFDWNKAPSGKGACELGDIGETSILYWSCHVKDAVTLRYQATPDGEHIHDLAAGQAVSVPTRQHCDPPQTQQGMVWISDGPQADGNDCRAPGGNDKGWVLASELECTDPSDAAIADISGCAPSDGCHSKYAQAPFTAIAPLNRYFNASGVDHFYTIDRDDDGYSYFGYAYETTEGHVHRDQAAGTVPLYRLWNPWIVDHFYTTSASEMSSAEANGWVFERVEGYVYDHAASGTVPLYRYWNAVGGDHFETITRNDAGYAAFGYGYETITAWVLP